MNDPSTIAAEPAPAPPDAPRRTLGFKLAAAAIGVVVLAIGAMWIYAWFFAPVGYIDRFKDPAWQARAEDICAATRQQVLALPSAASFKDIEPKSEALTQRAAVIDRATVLLERQIAGLRADEPSDATARKGVDLWLADWDGYLQSRREQADRLRAGRDDPFSVKEQGGAPVTLRMDEFAQTNDMPSCIVPDDIG